MSKNYPDRICKECTAKYTKDCKGLDKCPRHPKPYDRRKMMYKGLEDNG